MEKKKNLKLCSNCDGQIELDAIFCPYCGAETTVKRPVADNKNLATPSKSLSPEETLSSLYPPPYKPKGYDAPIDKEAAVAEEEVAVAESGKSSLLWPIVFLSIGFNFLLIGLFLLLFAGREELVFRWHTHFWFIYLLISLPLVFLGYRKISEIDQ